MFSDTAGTGTGIGNNLNARSLDELKDLIKDLQRERSELGHPLSGRVLHVCHYVPVTCSLLDKQPLTPPRTPDTDVHDASALNAKADKDNEVKWNVSPRSGHSAMISGIRSLSNISEQAIVGWTGELVDEHSNQPIPLNSLSETEVSKLEEAIRDYKESGETRHVGLHPLFLEETVARGHYEGYCKNILWPLFHYILWEDAVTGMNADEDWQAYLKANETYARRVAEIYKPGDLIWIHDYHLLLVPGMLRKLIPDALIGLFVHTPFPSSEIFRCLPKRKEVLDGMLGANLVCFQTYSYSRHFISSCIRVCGYENVHGGVDSGGQLTAIAHCAVGIDTERVIKDATLPGVAPKLTALRNLYAGKKIIVGRDKLDAVKGVVQKLKAFEKFLRDYPEWRNKVVLIQVTSPSLTDSSKLEHQVSELVSNINGEFGSLDFIPVHHYHQIIGKEEFYALLSAADLAVITPLRDGMNTTSLEFVLCQQKTTISPLILSEFTGISSNMSSALQVNPWNLGDVAATINSCLTMSAAEKQERHSALYSAVTTRSSHSWAANLVHLLMRQAGDQLSGRPTPRLDRDLLTSKYHSAQKRLFLFDYDGTLTPIVKVPSQAVPPEKTLQMISTLLSDPKNTVFIISGRDCKFLEEHFGGFKGIGMSGEHGAFIKPPNAEHWTNNTETLDMSWMRDVEEIFQYYTERTPGSHVEMKECSVTWHYRGSDPEWGLFQCRQCQDLLENNLTHKKSVEVLVGKKNLEVRPVAVNKGEIVKRLLRENSDVDFVFCAGDDKTDEDMFRALKLFQPGSSEAVLVSAVPDIPSTRMSVRPDGVFATLVGPSTKKTIAGWHVTESHELVDNVTFMLEGKE